MELEGFVDMLGKRILVVSVAVTRRVGRRSPDSSL
jgi:hypothetical protein